MKLNEVKRIKELYNDTEVNAALDEGYEILKIISSKSTTMDLDEVRPCYVLGKK